MAELKKKSNTVSAVDLFKCIFAICVVAIHTMAFKDHGESAYFAFTYCITSFAVPYFFVCSGYFLGRKIYGKDLQKSDYRLIIKKHTSKPTAIPTIFLTTNNYVWWGIYFFIGILLNESKLKEKYSCFKVSYQWMIVIAIYLIYMCVYWIFGKKFLKVSHLLKLIIVGIVFITTLNTKLNLKVE